MDLLRSVVVGCPYCGESLDIDVDCSVASQSYIEDCQVCCQPITYRVGVSAEEISVNLRRDNGY